MKKLFLILLLLAPLTFAEEPIKFRGAYIGQPISDWVDCSSGKAKPTSDGWKTHGKICEGKRGAVYHIKIRGVMNPKDEGEILSIEDSKVVEIKIKIPNEDWDKVRYDLTQKLGEPVSEAPATYQNGFGARWEFNRGFWEKGNIVAAAGIKVLSAIQNPLGSGPATEGIEITIMSTERAKMPSTTPNSLD